MKNIIRKVINYRYDRCEETELKLEALAKQGLLLEKCGLMFWTFRKGTPENLKYTITYFVEGSILNPEVTDNQQTYYDYAKEAGWEFVTDNNQMQIFRTRADNKVPFETDEQEKLNNIKHNMNKSFLPANLLMVLVYIFNIVVQYKSFQINPIDYMVDVVRLLSLSLFLLAFIYQVYMLIYYVMWCKQSQKSIDGLGKCINNNRVIYKIIDVTFIILMLANITYMLYHMQIMIKWFGIVLILIQLPILIFVFKSSIKYFKKKKAAARLNFVLSTVILIIVNVVYLGLLTSLIMNSSIIKANNSDYQTVDWKLTASESREYKLYHDDIPLKCEDLYGPIDHDFYSYEEKISNTLLLHLSSYRQDSPPAKDAPQEINYKILEPQYGFVYSIVKGDLLNIDEWRDKSSIEALDDEIFGTIEAYQWYYDGVADKDYVLFFEDVIIELHMDEVMTDEHIVVVKEQLGL